MIVGVPKEIKDNEYRVSMTPAGVNQLVQAGHKVLVQTGAGAGSYFSDTTYVEAGAEIVETAKKVWTAANMVVKVKEPLPAEYGISAPRPDLIHLPSSGRRGVFNRGHGRQWCDRDSL
jgi:alanine dehydrogenase